MYKRLTMICLLIILFSILYPEEVTERTNENQQRTATVHKLKKDITSLFKAESREKQFDWWDEKWGNNIPERNIKKETIKILVNGKDENSILRNEQFALRIFLSDDSYSAILNFWVDMDFNGKLNKQVDSRVQQQLISDNDQVDESKTRGQILITVEEGFNQVSNLHLLIQAVDNGGEDVVFLSVLPVRTEYSISGKIEPDQPFILIIAANEKDKWMTSSDETGSYQIFVDKPGEYIVQSFDIWDHLENMYTNDDYSDLVVDPGITGIDFHYIEP